MSKSVSIPPMAKGIRRMLLILIIGYLAIIAFVAIRQRSLLYFPRAFTTTEMDDAIQQKGFERWTNSAGQPIGIKRRSSNQPATGQVLVTYGNGSFAIGCARYADAIQAVAPFDVYILEYPGYADRPGSPSQKAIFQAADEALQTLSTNIPTYLIGESLGTGVSAYLAGTHPDKVNGIVLFAPYNRMVDVAQFHYRFLPVSLLLADRFPSEDYLLNFHGAVGIMVGGQDTVVPQKFGRRLYDACNEPKHLWEFPAANHWTVTEQPAEIWKKIVEFWQAVPASPR